MVPAMPLSPALRRVPLLLIAALPLTAADDPVYRRPSAPLAALVDAPSSPVAVLSPDRTRLLLLDRPEAPSIAELAQPELKLAGLRVNPATNGRSREATYTGLSFQPLEGGPARRVTGLPTGARIAGYEWSRDGRHLALTLLFSQGSALWLVDVATAAVRRLTDPVLNGFFGDPVAWLDSETLLVRRIPAGRGPAPVEPAAPAGPVVQESKGTRAGARTYDGLLTGPHDEALLDHYGTSELALIALDGAETVLPVRGLLSSVLPSPDGRHFIIETLRRPYSYLVPASRFPVSIDVHDRAGRLAHRVASLPLNEGSDNGSVRPGPRGVGWRADAPATLSWAQDLGRGAKQPDGKTARDAWFTHAAPFAGQPVELQRFEYRVTGASWGTTGSRSSPRPGRPRV